MAQSTLSVSKADYGLDAPTLVRKFLIIGPIITVIGLIAYLYAALTPTSSTFLNIVGSVGLAVLISGVICLLSGGAMIWSSRFGKMHARDRVLDGLQLRGDETVLDVGCGRGLLLLGAAKRLPHGRALGLDLWSQEDLSNNAKAATLANAQAEGVADRVEVYDGDMRKMPFADASIDAVVANMSIHNIYNRDGRREAINEIVRVLKTGGKVALMDFEHVAQYGDDLRVAGMQNVNVSGIRLWTYPPVRVATGNK